LQDALLVEASGGDAAAVAALLALWTGLRASEIVQLAVRDVDVGVEDGRRVTWLWVVDSKTTAGRRQVEVPPELGELLEQLSKDRLPGAWLFPTTRRSQTWHRRREWVLGAVKRFCAAAGVPVVSAHGLRGTNATLADRAGVAPREVARSLGHEDERTAAEHYSRAREDATRRRGYEVIRGGKG
jgi:integrase